MHNLLYCNVKMCKKVLTKDLVNRMHRCKIGTKDVLCYVSKICKNSKNKHRESILKDILMKEKLEDTKYEVRMARREFGWKYKEYHDFVSKDSRTDIFFRATMQAITWRVWHMGKQKNNNKIEFLKQKCNPLGNGSINEDKGEIRGVIYGDKKLERVVSPCGDGGNEPRIYGGASIEDSGRKLLEKDPNFMILGVIDMMDIELGIELGFAKARYDLMQDNEDEVPEEELRRNIHGQREGEPTVSATPKSVNYASMRATEIPTVPRLFPPQPGTVKQETIFENIKAKLLETAKKYRDKHCDEKGNLKRHNINSVEAEGLKEIQEKVKKGDLVVFSTDKSGRFSVDTPRNYEEAVHQHTTNDVEISSEGVKLRENQINLHMRQFNKMFQVGVDHGHEIRVTGATMSTNVQPPPLYGLRKDHKATTDEFKGPPVRPVCGANVAPNSRLSHFLSKIVNDYCDFEGIPTECRSSEEMRAAFEKYNETDMETRVKCRVISMDVKALYPSMEWEEITKSVQIMIEESDMEIESIDMQEVGKYLAVTMDKDSIKHEGLQHVIPQRKNENNHRITVSYLNDKRNDDEWLSARKPGKRQQRKMIGLAVAEGIRICLENHMYCVGDSKYLQTRGGPIGLELTGAVSRPFMARWDKLYLDRVKKAGIKMLLYERYVDDSNQIAIIPPPGAVYDQQTKKIVINQEKAREDSETDADERLAKILIDIANSVMTCIKMEGDWPSRNADQKLPILDMKVWTRGDGIIMYQHYEKAVSSKTVLHSESAHSAAIKRSVHTQEILRRLLNSSRCLGWNEVAPVITDYMKRMEVAGYKERYRKTVLEHAMSIYDGKWKAHVEGKRPLYRPKDYKKQERKNAKEKKKHQWAKKGGHIAPIFVPPTPGNQLLKDMRAVAEREARDGIRFNIIESGGATIKSKLQKSNPTAAPGCDKEECICCEEGRGKGGQCHRTNINYEIKCMLCPKESRPTYIGESSRNLITRMDEHQGAIHREGSFMRKHMEEMHRGQEPRFRARVTHTNKDCLTRQVREGVIIRHTKNALNTKSEWHLPALFRVNNEVVRE